MIRQNGEVTVYDTLDHQISGVSQQQSGTRTLTFSSQHGPVRLEDLPKVSVSHAQEPKAETAKEPSVAPEPSLSSTMQPSTGDPLELLERLGKLRAAGVITDAEFDAKKQELLKRI